MYRASSSGVSRRLLTIEQVMPYSVSMPKIRRGKAVAKIIAHLFAQIHLQTPRNSFPKLHLFGREFLRCPESELALAG
jgi:hypothetical protein